MAREPFWKNAGCRPLTPFIYWKSHLSIWKWEAGPGYQSGKGLVFLAFSPNSNSRRGDPESTGPSIFILDRVKEDWVIRKPAGAEPRGPVRKKDHL